MASWKPPTYSIKQPTQQPNISSDTVAHRGLVRSHPYSPVNLKYVWTRSRCTYLILVFFSVEVNSPRSFPASFAISTLWAQSILANEHFAACVWAPVRAFVTSLRSGRNGWWLLIKLSIPVHAPLPEKKNPSLFRQDKRLPHRFSSRPEIPPTLTQTSHVEHASTHWCCSVTVF